MDLTTFASSIETHTLSISGVQFDEVRIFGTGGNVTNLGRMGAALDNVVINTVPLCPCDLIAMSDFGAPMGKKKKLGSTIPVKFQMFLDDIEIKSQGDLDLLLELAGCDKACPEILITDVTDPANEVGLELPEDANVGEGGDLGFCFRYSDGNWIYNLKLPKDKFFSDRTYLVEVEIGDCIFMPGNGLFQIK